MFNGETVRQQYIKNLPFPWHNSHSKLIFAASKSPQYKQGPQEKQARIHSPTQENRKSKCFCIKKKWHQFSACIQFSASQEFTLPLQHYSARCLKWRIPKGSRLDRWVKLLSCSQKGCFHDMPERKQRLIRDPFKFFSELWVCVLGWMRQSSAAGLKDCWKWAPCLRLLGEKDPGKESSLSYFSIWTLCRAENITKLICKIAVGEESKISRGHKPEMSSILNGLSLVLAMLTVNYF